jgi:hypothetical protein
VRHGAAADVAMADKKYFCHKISPLKVPKYAEKCEVLSGFPRILNFQV